MTITLRTVSKVALVICSIILLSSIFVQGLTLNTTQTEMAITIFLLSVALFPDKIDNSKKIKLKSKK